MSVLEFSRSRPDVKCMHLETGVEQVLDCVPADKARRSRQEHALHGL
jgi:hypothetical protein